MPLKQEHRPTDHTSTRQQPRNERRSYKNISIYVTDLPPTPDRFSSSLKASRDTCFSALNYSSVLRRPDYSFSAAASYKRKLDTEVAGEDTPRKFRRKDKAPQGRVTPPVWKSKGFRS